MIFQERSITDKKDLRLLWNGLKIKIAQKNADQYRTSIDGKITGKSWSRNKNAILTKKKFIRLKTISILKE
jgi:hypothetical protein